MDYAFCDILQVGVEQGWIGLLLALLIVALVLRSERGTSKGMFACMLVYLYFPCFLILSVITLSGNWSYSVDKSFWWSDNGIGTF